MIKQELIINNKLGLHTRAASKVVNLTSKYLSDITIECNNNLVDAKSIIGLLTLAATKGCIITVTVNGSDEEELFEKFKKLINANFDDPE